MKKINDLLDINNYKIVQDTDYFSFSLDSILLCNFVNVNKDSKILDICSGNCPIPLILNRKVDNKIYAVEIQKEIYELGKETIDINNLSDKIELLNMDAKELPKMFETDTFDIITCNPPYFKNKELSKKNDNKIKSIARHEIEINLNDIFKLSRKLLKNNGSIVLVHRPERLIEIIETMKENNIEPKRIQFIYPKIGKESNTVLIEGTKNGKPGLKILNPIIVHNEDGDYNEEIKKMFKGE
ncbi:MAG: tRNA1(Val) (adenine(37)-N6)-methyltransferase [Bacilli bacterium]|nr:tRNA1(Val) (adenine(37)-N6)-methyltransferase [Bacilli bacterium]